MRLNCLIFDCDGVLVDSEMIAARVAAESFTSAGLPVSVHELVTRFSGMAGDQVTAALAERYSRQPDPGMTDARRVRIMEAFTTELKAISGISEVLSALQQPRCVASSSHPERIAHSLAITGLARHFGDRVFSSTMVKCGKPAPDLFLYAADKLGVRPGECLVIEDSVSGVQGAKAAGMTVFGFFGGSHCAAGHAERLKAQGADAVFAAMEQLPGLIQNWK